ncbi:TPA: MerR family DNA-binding transcriptional regulator, partial [Acinetobacter baumannii]
MNISQISKKYGLSLDTLRFYEKCGVLVPERLTNG